MKTLQIHLSIKAIVFHALIFFLFVGVVELLLRTDMLSSRLAAPSFGSEHHQFEIQLARLKAAYKQQESIDCIFIGDSLVWLDLDPLQFGQGYQNQTNSDIQCFNFGIAALPASGVSALTEILVRDYNPRLIVYGLHANSLVVGRESEDTTIVLDTQWVEFKSGVFNIRGWLYENSYFVRYLHVLSRVIQFDREVLTNELGMETYQLLGFDPKVGQRIDVNIPPSRTDEADIPGFEKYYTYQVFSENVEGIHNIAELADDDTNVVMVIMPVHKSFYAFFKHGEQDYSELIDVIEETLTATDAIIIKPANHIQLPDSAWWDYSHLNISGAEEFSYWLGREVGNLLFHD